MQLEHVNQTASDETRRLEMISMRQSGISYQAIGDRWGITAERVRQVTKEIPQKPPARGLRSSLSTRDVAQLLGIHPNTVRRWANNGTLKSYRIGPRGDRRFHREDIQSMRLKSENNQ